MLDRLSTNLHVDITYAGHIRYKNTSVLIVLRNGLSQLDGLQQSQVLAILTDQESKLYVNRTQFMQLKSIYMKYAEKLVLNDVITAQDAAQIILEISEFEDRGSELSKAYAENNTGGNFEEVMRPEAIV